MNDYVKVRYEKVCSYCGRSFEAHNKSKMYCSRKCRDIAYKTNKGLNVNTNLEPYHKTCIICGKQYETYRDNSLCCSPKCTEENKKQKAKKYKKIHPRKTKHTQDEYKNIVKAQAEQRKLKKELENEWIRLSHTVERTCVICGSKFYCLDREINKTCSHECSRKYINQRSDKRISKAIRKDFISLRRLYKRDKGICYLCGEKCDFSSKNISKKGTEYCGDLYPTIEHVIPISKGGLHSWDNVRLACWKCNTKKADGVIEVEPISREIAYSERYTTGAKRTAQYTLDGKLIRVWESTGAIKRELGLNDRQIQKACRHMKCKTGNAFGYHWEYI